jgi:hypothetical protein
MGLKRQKMKYLAISGENFVDDQGRSLILRGVNLGGSSKVPAHPDGRTHLKDDFYEGANVSFVGRPFPLDQADEHFARLARWGQRFVRLVVTWEAIEHTGPGIYDTTYLDYLEGIVESAAHNEILLFIDPHQDVWSRWTGGDGAPMWTLEILGFEPRTLHASGAAMLHQELGIEYPRMQWFSNHLRLACATMFTLFFAGNDFAPGILVQGEPIQEFLQNRYCDAFAALARRLASFPNVLGFGSMNEPGKGFIGICDAAEARRDLLLPGLAPTPWEAMQAGEGLPVDTVDIQVKGGNLHPVRRTPLGMPSVRAWEKDEICVWRRVGMWDIERGRGVLKKPRWFSVTRNDTNTELDQKAIQEIFNERYLRSFIQKFSARMDETRREAERRSPFMLFIESPPMHEMPHFDNAPNIINETHWYDSLTLTLKRWTGFLAYDEQKHTIIIGARAVRRYFKNALTRIVQHSHEALGNCPTLLGEFGLPFDLNNRIAYRTKNFSVHERALSAYYDALDANLLSATLWNYTADTDHDYGDGWNGEDLSVFCAQDGGGRALRGFVRPYAMEVAGKMHFMRFSARRGIFAMEFAPNHEIAALTVIFVPLLQYPRGASISVTGGTCSEERLKIEGKAIFRLPPIKDQAFLKLFIKPDPHSDSCRIRISRVNQSI